MKYALAFISLGLLAGCSSSGPTFRGDPPPGYTRAQYERKLSGKTDFTHEYRNRDRSPDAEAAEGKSSALWRGIACNWIVRRTLSRTEFEWGRVMAVNSKGLAAQQRAVRAHKERVFVVSRTFRTGPDIIRVLFKGNYYDVGPADFARLEGGKLTPEDLELYPVDQSDLWDDQLSRTTKMPKSLYTIGMSR